jgi:hypothetical protein
VRRNRRLANVGRRYLIPDVSDAAIVQLHAQAPHAIAARFDGQADDAARSPSSGTSDRHAPYIPRLCEEPRAAMI